MKLKQKLLTLCLFTLAVLSLQGALKFGVIPLESPENMHKQFTPLVQYLSKELDTPVELVIGKDYQDSINAIGKNEVQLVFLTPATLPKAQRLYTDAGIMPIARFLNGGKGSFKGCVIVPVDSSIKKLEDFKSLQTIKLATVSSTSIVTNLMIRSILADHGIAPNAIHAEHLGNHTNVAQAVSLEQFSMGGVLLSVGKQFEEKGEVRIIMETPLIPEFPICANKQVDGALKEKLLSALMKLDSQNADHKAVLAAINAKYTGCELAKDADYDVIRTMIKNVYGDVFYKRE